MSNTYLGYHFTIISTDLSQQTIAVASEILMAQLGEQPFESFVENESGIVAYIQKEHSATTILDDIALLKSEEFIISHTIEEIAPVNWNEEWEKNFEATEVDGRCCVRAPFHEKTNVEFDIIIEPKMSFGTGHHETTHMMIQHLLETDVANKKTLDMGCGTAILAVLAEMKGAKPIDAIDIDNWCYLNSIENAERNNCNHIQVFEGDVALIHDKKYDVIIANINRNILLNDMKQYVQSLNTNGILLLSGFYNEDIAAINTCCTDLGLAYVKKFERNNWVSLKYTKK